jgi:hypothetical protein
VPHDDARPKISYKLAPGDRVTKCHIALSAAGMRVAGMTVGGRLFELPEIRPSRELEARARNSRGVTSRSWAR